MHWNHAADEFGIMSTQDTRRAGLGPAQVRRMVKERELSVLGHGWYGARPAPDALGHHVLRTRAALRAHEGRAVASYHSALVLHGLPLYQADLSIVSLSRREPGPTRQGNGVRLRRAVPGQFQGEHAVTPAAAVVQHGKACGLLPALVAADAGLRLGLMSRQDLIEALSWATNHPRFEGLDAMIELADGRHESAGETLLGHTFRLIGIQATPQVRIVDEDFSAVADFLIDGTTVIVEFDGKVKYSRSPDEPDPFGNRRSGADVLWAEKQREDHLRAMGYVVVRVTWDDLADPGRLARRIREAIATSRQWSSRAAV